MSGRNDKLASEVWRDDVTLNHGVILCAVVKVAAGHEAWWFYDGVWSKPDYVNERLAIFEAWAAYEYKRAESTQRKLSQAWAENTVLEGERDDARASLAVARTEVEDVWLWQGDGHDHPESLSCPVVMRAATLRALLAERDTWKARAEEAERLYEIARRERHDLQYASEATDLALATLRAKVANVVKEARPWLCWDRMAHGDECPHRYCEAEDCGPDGTEQCDDSCESPDAPCTCSVGAENSLRVALRALVSSTSDPASDASR